MFDDFDDPGPCPVCGAAHSACIGDSNSVTGGVVVISQMPARDAAIAATTAATPEPPPATVRKTGARPIRRPVAAGRSRGAV